MSALDFDQQGNLIPYEPIETSWESFTQTFGWNTNRRMLIDSFRSFLLELGKFPIGLFNVWVDGSFVTQKDHPNDLDAVCFLPAGAYELIEQELRTLRSQFIGLDIYFVKVIEEGTPAHFLYVSDRTEWLFQFTMTRPHKVTRRKFPKGFLNIQLGNEQAFGLI